MDKRTQFQGTLRSAFASKAEGSNYIGLGDNLLDFGKSVLSFRDEDKSGKTFSMRIQNTGDGDMTLALCPAFFTDASKISLNGIEIDSIVKDGEIVKGTKKSTVSGTPRNVSSLLGYLLHTPSRLLAIQVKVDDPSQLDEPFILRYETPFSTSVELQKIPGDYQTQSDSNQQVIRMDDLEGWILSSQSTLLYKIREARTATITFTFGASLDIVKGLDKKAAEAKGNL